MAEVVRFDASPKITDIVRLEFATTDESGDAGDPYLVEQVVVYFLERTYGDSHQESFAGLDAAFTNARPVKIVGRYGEPAWIVGGEEPQMLESLGDGLFRLDWDPQMIREGDYVLSWTWRMVPGGTTQGRTIQFSLLADTSVSTASPTHRTVPGKYEHLFDIYLPERFKMRISEDDKTAEVLTKLNNAAAGGFTFMEDMANQLLDLLDANALNEAMLPYLANLFGLRLRSDNPTLWRRQVKTAVAQAKRKGTIGALRESLDAIGVELRSFRPLWQVVSPYTWAEHFVATEGQAVFALERPPVVDDPVDPANFEAWVRPGAGGPYAAVSLSQLEFSASPQQVVYDGEPLAAGDILKVVYKVESVPDQTIEDHIRTLPLADRRDEAEVTYPPKNWNVRLIEEDDPFFPLICPTRHPYRQRLVFGTVRTIFPYGEKMYNSEEYNGSFRDSYDPCDIAKDFLDDCTCCRGSQFAMDVVVNDLTGSRKSEVDDAVRENVPFHATPLAINYTGGMEEILLPPAEEMEILATVVLEDATVAGPPEFNRAIQAGLTNPTRDILATAVNAATRTDGSGFAEAQVFHSPTNTFEAPYDEHLFHVLSGVNQDLYTSGSVDNPNMSTLDVLATMPFPDDASTFPFKVSYPIWNGTASVYQDDLAYLTDRDGDPLLTGVAVTSPPWKVVVTAGPNAGTYDVSGTHPVHGVQISGWAPTSAVTGLSYTLLDQFGNEQQSGTRGRVDVTRRGRLEAGVALADDYAVRPGHFFLYGTSYYQVLGLDATGTKAYVAGWTSGTAAGISARIVRVDNQGTDGTLAYRGSRLETTIDHHAALSVDDYSLNDFMVQVGSYYYQVVSWANTPNLAGRYEIELAGLPRPSWTLAATPNVTYTIIRFDKTSPVTVQGVSLDYIGRTPVGESIDTVSASAMMSTPLRAALLQPGSGRGMRDAVALEDEIEVIVQKRKTQDE